MSILKKDPIFRVETNDEGVVFINISVSTKYEHTSPTLAVYSWLIFQGLLFFAPPIPLGFTETASLVSWAIMFSILYLVARMVYYRFSLISPLFTAGFIFYLIFIYFGLHSIVFLMQGKMNVFLMEFQWITYFQVSFLLLWDMRDKENVEIWHTRNYLWILFIEGIFGIITSFTGPLYDAHMLTYYDGRFIDLYRAIGTVGSANGFAGLMAFALVVTIYTPSSLLRWKHVMILVFSLALTCSQSKSGVVSMFLAIICTTMLRSIFEKSIRNLVLICAAVAVGCIGFYYGSEIYTLLGDDFAERSAYSDYVLNQYAENDILSQLFGVGFRQTAYINSDTQAWITAHNSYISMLAEIGLTGITILSGLWVTSLFYLAKSKSWNLFAGLLAILAHFFTEGFVYGPFYIYLISCLFVMSYFAYENMGSKLGRKEKYT